MEKKIKNEKFLVLTFMIIAFAFIAMGAFVIIKGYVENNWAMIVYGSIFVVIGFYSTISMINKFKLVKRSEQIAVVISKNNSITVAKISEELEMSEGKINRCIKFILDGDYLPGYVRNGDEIVNINRQQSQNHERLEKIKEIQQKRLDIESEKLRMQKNRKTVKKCPCCGARVAIVGDSAVCNYCGNIVDSDK